MKYNLYRILRISCVLSLSLSSASVCAMEAPEEEDWKNFFQSSREMEASLLPIHDIYKRTNEAHRQDLIEPSETEVKKTRKEGEVMETFTTIADDQIANIIDSLRAEEKAEQFLLMKEKNYPLALEALLDAEVFAAYDPHRRCALNRKIGDLYFQLNEGEASVKQAVRFYVKATHDNIDPVKRSSLFERAGNLTSQLTMPDRNSFMATDYYALALSEINKALEITKNGEKKSVLFEKKAELVVKLNDNRYSSQAADAYSMAVSLTSDKGRKYKLLFSKATLKARGQEIFTLLEACNTYAEAAALLAEQGQYAEAAKVSNYGVSLIERVDNFFDSYRHAELMLKSSYYYYKSANLNDCHNWLNRSYSYYEQMRNNWDDENKIMYLYNFAYIASKLESTSTLERALSTLKELKFLAESYDFEKDYVETMIGKVEVNKLKQGESLLRELASQ
ncbi:MAG: hypothetical protein K0M45_11780 [Candidatus Paracaedibacteraceae bacterium]|nr:hypothetical protein [Candidatus Paracaedibacteraceae bacterium]